MRSKLKSGALRKALNSSETLPLRWEALLVQAALQSTPGTFPIPSRLVKPERLFPLTYILHVEYQGQFSTRQECERVKSS